MGCRKSGRKSGMIRRKKRPVAVIFTSLNWVQQDSVADDEVDASEVDADAKINDAVAVVVDAVVVDAVVVFDAVDSVVIPRETGTFG